MAVMEEEELANCLRCGLEGDQKAYESFLKDASRIARAIVNGKASFMSVHDQEDIVQDILLAIHHKRGTWRQDHPVKPWVNAICRYKVIDVYRKQGKADFVDIDEMSEILPAEEQNASEAMDVESMVSKLNGKQALVIQKVCMESKSFQDAAKELNMAEGTLRVNFHRALTRLRELGAQEV